MVLVSLNLPIRGEAGISGGLIQEREKNMEEQQGQTAVLEEEYEENGGASQEQIRIAKEAAQFSAPAKPKERLLDEILENATARRVQEVRADEMRFEFQQRRAKLFASSGLFTVKGVDGNMAIAQAMVKIELGEAMGFTPAESLQGINIINGVTSISSALRASKMQAGGYGWTIQWLGNENECTGCRLWLTYRGRPIVDRNGDQVSEAFTQVDAGKMLTTIYKDDPKFPGDYKKRIKTRVSILEKENWQMSPRNMYFARAITNAQRFYAPSALNVNILSTEEAYDIDPEEAAKPTPSISLDAVKTSNDPNRGHDAVSDTPTPELKHLGAREGLPVFNTFPAATTVTNGQKLWIKEGDSFTMYEFVEDHFVARQSQLLTGKKALH